MPTLPPVTDLLLRVRGTVQGVGFRPFVHRTAVQLGLHGWVRNDAEGVLIRAVGEPGRIEALHRALLAEAPAAARITEVAPRPPTPDDQPAGTGFVIADSDGRAGLRSAALPPDLALCADCRRELLDPQDRRHRYPFLNCTQCGPRYSIIESLPYDRPRTAMRVFRMCPACRQEYQNPADRRFHAEPNACALCGPRLTLTDPAGDTLATGDDAVTVAAVALQAGKIVAVKGIGGFHLMCDAGNDTAVRTLRHRKHREEKPFAVMFPDLASLRVCTASSPAAESLLQSPAAPIVLVPRRPEAPLATALAPGNPWIGAMLPYAPLHALLLAAAARPLVATSANYAEEPLCTDNAEARERLLGVADLHLVHDRPIRHAVDDSVVRLVPGGDPILLRRARGYAPSPFRLPTPLARTLLCVGAEQKSTVALAARDQIVLSPHLGDLGLLGTEQAFERAVATLRQLHTAEPDLVVHDKHPDYSSTRFALRQALPTLAVQHHLAHLLACLLDNNETPDDVLGVTWDGTGYGEDGTIWGGEFILLKAGRAERFARLRPFRLPGGAAAIRDAGRVALALAYEMGDFDAMAARGHYSPEECSVLRVMVERGLNSPLCSSAGRLFDGAGALLGLGRRNAFEGQTPLAVEAAALRGLDRAGALPFQVIPAVTPGARLEVDWHPVVEALLDPHPDPEAGAAAFHRGLAHAIAAVARAAGAGTVALTGGCFQNALLHALTVEALQADGFRVLVHRHLPPNDNAIAAGQALAALWNLSTVNLP